MRAEDPAWVDAQYNNRARVPESGAHLARWSHTSAEVRAAGQALLDLPYGDGPDDRLDLFPARGGGSPAPVVVFLHGGYWRSLSKDDHAFVAPALTAAGLCVAVPEYSLCPGPAEAPVSIATITEQMARALAWLRRHAERYGGDPKNLTVVGHSAGGQLAGVLLARSGSGTDPSLPDQPVPKAVSISGLHDLAPLRRWAPLQQVVNLTPEQIEALSPARLPPPPSGVAHAWVGGAESEEFHRQLHLLQAAWGRERVPVCEALPGLNHFSAVEALADPGSRLFAATVALARS